MNQRMHWHQRRLLASRVRTDARVITRAAAVPPMQHVTVEMVWIVPDKRRRDADNPVLTSKSWCDGMVDAGIVPDDTPQWMTKLMPRIEYVKGKSAVTFFVTGIPVESEAS